MTNQRRHLEELRADSRGKWNFCHEGILHGGMPLRSSPTNVTLRERVRRGRGYDVASGDAMHRVSGGHVVPSPTSYPLPQCYIRRRAPQRHSTVKYALVTKIPFASAVGPELFQMTPLIGHLALVVSGVNRETK